MHSWSDGRRAFSARLVFRDFDVWLALLVGVFGAVAVPIVADAFGWRLLAYAVLSITVVRMLPVALALLGSGLGHRAALFMGWFGPRGLASVVFALLAVEELGPQADTAVAVIVTTVLVSVLAHGVTAAPLATRYGAGLIPTASTSRSVSSRSDDAAAAPPRHDATTQQTGGAQ